MSTSNIMSNDKGFIKLSRKFFNNAYWNQKRTFSLSEAWLDLIQLARFEERPTDIILPNGREISIERGEIRASLRFLSERWGWGVEKTKKFIDKHIEKQEIERRTEQGESIIKLCNYDSYNSLSNTDQYTDQYTGRTPTSTPTSTNNKKEKKEEEREEYIIPPLPPKGNEIKTWKNNFSLYLEDLKNAYQDVINDSDWISKQESFNPGVDIVKSIEKACSNYWETEAGWKKKKSSKIKTPDWRSTFANAVSLKTNRVYYGNNFKKQENNATSGNNIIREVKI